MSGPARSITIPARPLELSIDPYRTALLVIDMQNDFGSPGGFFDSAGNDITGFQAIVPRIQQVLAAARDWGILVVYLKMEVAPSTRELEPGALGQPDRPIEHAGQSLAAPNGTEGRVLVRGYWNTEIVPELTPLPGDLVVSKHRYSGFYQTNLDELLIENGITDLIFTGSTTSVCVESTLRDAYFRDYRCLLIEDCTSEPIRRSEPFTSKEATIAIVERAFGWITDSSALLQALAVPIQAE